MNPPCVIVRGRPRSGIAVIWALLVLTLLGVTTAKPTRSLPRRPARPASCWISLTVRSVKSRALRMLDCVTTTVRAGKSTPAAKVVVANTASRQPWRISSSTAIFHDGRWPA